MAAFLRRRRPGADALDRGRGALLGLAVGDALGAPVEWLHPGQIHARYGGRLRDMVASSVWERGEWTDDTAMALELAASLAERGGYEEDDVLARYVLWARSGPKDIGATVAAALKRARSADEARAAAAAYHEASGGRSAGNGSLMRSAPIGLRFWNDDAELERCARLDSSLTHHDPLAGEACVVLDRALAALVADRDLPRPRGEVSEAAATAPALSDEELVEAVHREVGFALTALRVGFAAALSAATFEQAVVRAVNLGGDADTNGAVAGALAGARFGASSIPERWLEPLQARERIAGIAGRLLRP
jgi:ADP-ribosyl-[dinitrogen reductase] hydrolase